PGFVVPEYPRALAGMFDVECAQAVPREAEDLPTVRVQQAEVMAGGEQPDSLATGGHPHLALVRRPDDGRTRVEPAVAVGPLPVAPGLRDVLVEEVASSGGDIIVAQGRAGGGQVGVVSLAQGRLSFLVCPVPIFLRQVPLLGCPQGEQAGGDGPRGQ